jgi:hypothetical protein
MMTQIFSSLRCLTPIFSKGRRFVRRRFVAVTEALCQGDVLYVRLEYDFLVSHHVAYENRSINF